MIELRDQLNRAGVTDDMIARGVQLTQAGVNKLTRRYNCTPDELKMMLNDLSQEVKSDTASTGLPEIPGLTESSEERYQYESDVLGNVTLRDTKTAASKFLQGDEAFKLLKEIEIQHPDYQSVISPYFNPLTEEVNGDVGQAGGTYNFPFRGNFACARFWMEDNHPKVEVISVVDANGEEVNLDSAAMAEANQTAWEWVDRV